MLHIPPYSDHYVCIYSAAQCRETGVLNAYFSAGAISAVAEDCHNQRIASCPCNIDTPRKEEPNGDIVLETCKADYGVSAQYFDGFVLDQVAGDTVQGRIDRHNINVGKQVCAVRDSG